MIQYPLPILGFCAFSGTGKTTLLERLIPLLKSRRLRIGVIKHAHHSFDVDHAGKDSCKLRDAGADQMLVASRNRIAWIRETPEQEQEPTLADLLHSLLPDQLDLVLVEGFKHTHFPKIELHRSRLGKPLIHTHDTSVIAVATDIPRFISPTGLPALNLNRPDEIADFIEEKLRIPGSFDDCPAENRVAG
ncbi:MAG: molybdopterin-guanine dinucleotide biosynthesis protein B [Gammaproteobacteria bacterium]|nr:molybdopterin-guanine dinucleotide biosynthesis protein B [Gammaproteobacteria bacterium]